ncbi:creatininase family protein, partial [Burkholderia sp. AU4i]|uniref:creatininase family protein n=1 Tax=Burkholderia sp. AU4i TaxID=1335308 RepID=UPI0005B4B319
MRFILQFAFAPIVALSMAHPVMAQTPKTVQLEDLTWTEVRDQIHAGKTTIIIPIGGTEQSGPYVALGKHNMRVKVLSQRIAERLGNTLVAPVIAYVVDVRTEL